MSPMGCNKHRSDDVDDREPYVRSVLQPRRDNLGTRQIVGQHHEKDREPSELVYGLQSLLCIGHMVLHGAYHHGRIRRKLKSASMDRIH